MLRTLVAQDEEDGATTEYLKMNGESSLSALAAGDQKWNSPPYLVVSPRPSQGNPTMVIGVAHLQPIVALVAGILILIIPRLLNIIVAIYLIFIGIVGLGIIR